MISRIVGWPYEGLAGGFAELEKIRRDLDRWVNGKVGEEGFDMRAGVYPLLNVSQDHDNYYVRSEIPGLSLEDLDLSVTGRSLTLAGERKIAAENKRVRFHRREREGGKFRRQLNLPTEVDGENVQARYRHGILMVVLPKAESSKPKKIQISG